MFRVATFLFSLGYVNLNFDRFRYRGKEVRRSRSLLEKLHQALTWTEMR